MSEALSSICRSCNVGLHGRFSAAESSMSRRKVTWIKRWDIADPGNTHLQFIVPQVENPPQDRYMTFNLKYMNTNHQRCTKDVVPYHTVPMFTYHPPYLVEITYHASTPSINVSESLACQFEDVLYQQIVRFKRCLSANTWMLAVGWLWKLVTVLIATSNPWWLVWTIVSYPGLKRTMHTGVLKIWFWLKIPLVPCHGIKS